MKASEAIIEGDSDEQFEAVAAGVARRIVEAATDLAEEAKPVDDVARNRIKAMFFLFGREFLLTECGVVRGDAAKLARRARGFYERENSRRRREAGERRQARRT